MAVQGSWRERERGVGGGAEGPLKSLSLPGHISALLCSRRRAFMLPGVLQRRVLCSSPPSAPQDKHLPPRMNTD